MRQQDEADLELLSLANGKRKFAIEVVYNFEGPHLYEAFERGIDRQWFTLVDIGPTAITGNRIMKVFRLTDAGMERLAELGGTRRSS